MLHFARKKNLNKRSLKWLIPLTIAVLFLGLGLIMQELLRKKTTVAEWVSLNISSRIISFMGRITSLIPFSIFEWLVILFFISILALIIFIIIALVKRRFYSLLKYIAISATIILSLLNIYILSAGYMYYRKPIELPSTATVYEVYKNEDALDISDFFVDRINTLSDGIEHDKNGNIVSPYTFSELAELLQDEYKRLDNGYFFEYTPKFKSLTNSWFMSSTDYAGVSFLPLGEPSVNKLMPISDIVFTAAHELAHTKGVMREYEANMTAYYILLTSENEFLQYCGLINYIYEIPTIAYLGNNLDYDIYTQVIDKISQSAKNDYYVSFKYWIDYKGPFDWLGDWFTNIGDWFNNLYLKFNGAPDGTGSYDNPWDYEDTGKTDPETDLPIYEPVYSNIHKILFFVYEQCKGE